MKVRNFRLIETDVGLGPTGIASSDVMCLRGGTRLQNTKPQEWCKIRPEIVPISYNLSVGPPTVHTRRRKGRLSQTRDGVASP